MDASDLDSPGSSTHSDSRKSMEAEQNDPARSMFYSIMSNMPTITPTLTNYIPGSLANRPPPVNARPSTVPMTFSTSFMGSVDPAPLFHDPTISHNDETAHADQDDEPYGEDNAAYYGHQIAQSDQLTTSYDGLSALGGSQGEESSSSSGQYAWAAGSIGKSSSQLQPSSIYQDKPPTFAPTFDGRGRDPRLENLLPNESIPPSLASIELNRRRYRDVPFAVIYILTMVIWLCMGFSLMLSTSSHPLDGYTRGTAFAAVRDTAGLLAFMIGMSVAAGAAWIWWLRKFVKLFVWATLTCMPVVAITLFLWTLIESVQSDAQDSGLTVVSFIPVILGLFWGRLVYKKRKQIDRTVAVVKLSCDILRSQPTIIVYSFFLLVAYTLFSLLWVAFFSRLLLLGSFTGGSNSMASGVESRSNTTMTDEPISVETRSMLKGTWTLESEAYWGIAFFTGVLFWTSAVFGNLQRVGISAVVGEWYFHRHDPPDENRAPLVDGSFLYQPIEDRPPEYRNGEVEMYAFESTPTHVAFQRAGTTLLGSVCLGGLCLGVVKSLQVVVGMLRRYFRNHPSSSTALAIIFHVVTFIDGIIEAINNYTLIYVGLTGESFCTSARSATKVFRRNLISGFVTDLITRLVLYLLAFTMAAISAVSVYLFASHSLHNPFAWLVSSLAMIVPAYIGVFWGRILTNTIDATYMAYAIDMDTGKNHCTAAHKAFGGMDGNGP